MEQTVDVDVNLSRTKLAPQSRINTHACGERTPDVKGELAV